MDTFSLEEPEERRPLVERLRPVISVGSVAVIAAMSAIWLGDFEQESARRDNDGPLSALVHKSKSGAWQLASEALDAAGSSQPTRPPAASKLSPASKTGKAGKQGGSQRAVGQPRVYEPSAAEAPARVAAEPNEAPSGSSPAPGATPDLDGSFRIQVASLRLKKAATRLAERLRKKGFRASSERHGYSRSGWWHVVRIGPFPTRVDAEARRLQLDPAERETAVVLPRARGKYHVQVASLRSMEEAQRLRERLHRQGYQARIASVGKVGESRWHCVRIGPLDTREEAEDFRRLLEAREGVTSQVVPFKQSEASER